MLGWPLVCVMQETETVDWCLATRLGLVTGQSVCRPQVLTISYAQYQYWSTGTELVEMTQTVIRRIDMMLRHV